MFFTTFRAHGVAFDCHILNMISFFSFDFSGEIDTVLSHRLSKGSSSESKSSHIHQHQENVSGILSSESEINTSKPNQVWKRYVNWHLVLCKNQAKCFCTQNLQINWIVLKLELMDQKNDVFGIQNFSINFEFGEKFMKWRHFLNQDIYPNCFKWNILNPL